MTIDEIRDRLLKIEDLPALPTIIAEINELLGNPKTTAPELSRVIMRDPSITARVLKIVNSPLYGLPKKVTSVNHAIVALGFNTVRSIVLCSSVMHSFEKAKGKCIDQKKFWAYSVGVAAAARVVARNAGEKKTEGAFVTGLLHGIGRIVLDGYFGDLFRQAHQIAHDESIPLWDAERRAIGVSSPEVTGVLLEMWKLDRSLADAVRFQENPEAAPETERALSAYIHVGSVLARVLRLGDAGDMRLPRISQSTMDLAKVEAVQWPRLLELAADESRRASVFFEG